MGDWIDIKIIGNQANVSNTVHRRMGKGAGHGHSWLRTTYSAVPTAVLKVGTAL